MATVYEKMTALADEIRAKTGGTTPLSIDGMTAAIASIGNAGGVVGNGEFRVRFFDFDGTILKTQLCNAGEAAEAPAIPDHERLVFQEWNNDFDDITDDLDVGAIYTTKSGMSEFDFDLNAQTGKSIEIGLRIVDVPFTLDWGDGSIETISTAGDATFTHEYPAYGIYTVKCSCAGDWKPQSPFVKSNAYALTAAYIAGVPNLWGGNLFQAQHALSVLSIEQNNYTLQWTYFVPGCDVLRHLNIPRGALRIDLYFALNSGLRSVSLPSDVTMGDCRSMFSNCKALHEVVLPTTTTTIKTSMFTDSGVQELVIPTAVTSFEGLVFGSTLKKLTLKPTTPPTILENSLPTTGQLKKIIVPKGCAAAYKAATNWSTFADIIKEEE